MNWQPIETAPKDGTPLVLWEQYDAEQFVGWWSNFSKRWIASKTYYDTDGDANVIDRVCSEGVTHWMPLPPPPGAAQPPQAAPKAVAVECSKTFGCQCPKHFRAAPAERGVPLTDEQAHAIAAHYDMPSSVVRDIYNRANGITGGTEGGASA